MPTWMIGLMQLFGSLVSKEIKEKRKRRLEAEKKRKEQRKKDLLIAQERKRVQDAWNKRVERLEENDRKNKNKAAEIAKDLGTVEMEPNPYGDK